MPSKTPSKPVLHVVHCIDTEGPLDEDLAATFKRLQDLFGISLPPSPEMLAALQRRALCLNGIEEEVAAVVSPALLAYNRSWNEIRSMLAEALAPEFRREMLGDDGGGWVYSWHCLDHLGYTENPRHKDLGYGKIFHFYREILAATGSSQDEINWHFHPLSLTRQPLAAATSYANSMETLLAIIARRILDDGWFPTTNRPGFHSERPDSNLFLEQWIPFDYANQSCDEPSNGQLDTHFGRFGDWRRAPRHWLGYHPHHDDYQCEGNCRRWIFRCLNVGTRLRQLAEDDVRSAFVDARGHGSAILAFADHDYRDIRPDVRHVRMLLEKVRRDFPDVDIRFSGAEAAARAHLAATRSSAAEAPPSFDLWLEGNRLHAKKTGGSLFGPQPFLALKTRQGNYHHDNLDIVEPGLHWTYVLDEQTLPIDDLDKIGVASAGRCGGYGIATLSAGLPRE